MSSLYSTERRAGGARPRLIKYIARLFGVCSRLPVVGDRIHRMSSADIAACFPSEHDSLLGNDVESRRRSSKPFYLSRSSLQTRDMAQGGLAGWWARFGEGGAIFDAFLMEASQQVGQSLLTLPWAFSLMGLVQRVLASRHVAAMAWGAPMPRRRRGLNKYTKVMPPEKSAEGAHHRRRRPPRRQMPGRRRPPPVRT